MKGFWPFTVNTEEEEIELAVCLVFIYQLSLVICLKLTHFIKREKKIV